MGQKTEVTIEKAVVTLSRGLRNAVLAGKVRSALLNDMTLEELDWVLRKAVFTFRVDPNFRIDLFTVKHNTWKNSYTCAEFITITSWVYLDYLYMYV
jgi:hypothetical protein